MNLITRCSQLREQIKDHGRLLAADKQAEAFRERASELKIIRELITFDVERAKVLKGKGTSLRKAADPSNALSALAAYNEALDTPEIDSGRQFGLAKRTLGTVQRHLASEVSNMLDKIATELPATDEVFLNLVEKIPGYEDQVARIRLAVRDLQGGERLASMSATQLEAFLNRRDTLRALADNLQPSQFPPEVLDFFRATRQINGAPLAKLNDSVRAWLAERDLLKFLRLTVVSR